MTRRVYWQIMLREAEAFCRVVRWSVVFANSRVAADPTLLPAGTSASLLRDAAEAVDGLSLVRIFSTFEAALRESYPSLKQGQPPPTRTRDLVDSVASRRSVPAALTAAAHGVREARNEVVHRSRPDPVDVLAGKQVLSRFLKYLPPDWPEDES